VAGAPLKVGKFQALIFRRIMTGGHVDAANGFAMADVVGDDRRRRVAITKQRFQAVGGEHLGGGQ